MEVDSVSTGDDVAVAGTAVGVVILTEGSREVYPFPISRPLISFCNYLVHWEYVPFFSLSQSFIVTVHFRWMDSKVMWMGSFSLDWVENNKIFKAQQLCLSHKLCICYNEAAQSGSLSSSQSFYISKHLSWGIASAHALKRLEQFLSSSTSFA